MKPRIQPYISLENYQHLLILANRPGCSISSVTDDAITAYRSDKSDDNHKEVLFRRLDRLTRQYGRLERNDLIISETLSTFIRYFMTITPPVPENQLDAARAKGDLRFDLLIQQVDEAVLTGRSTLLNAIEELTADKTDYFTEAELDPLAQACTWKGGNQCVTRQASSAPETC